MALKIYISGLSGNKEVKKRQQRVMMILESKHIPYQLVDITEPGNEDEKEFMQQNAKVLEGSKYALPPQIFMGSEYCGDYEQFDLSNENDKLESFLKLSEEEIERIKAVSTPRASPAKDYSATANGVGSKEVARSPVVESTPNPPAAEGEEPAPADHNEEEEEEEEEEEDE